MSYALGIDAGGTYTDVIIINRENGSVIDTKKTLTTYPNLQFGISDALNSLDQKLLHKVNLVSVSTTLSTNALLEGTGTDVGLILIGQTTVEQTFPTQHVIHVQGGHGPTGEEEFILDVDVIRNFVQETQNVVEAYAISAFFGVRNPSHELETKSIIQKITQKPIVCGHELSQELGAYERAVTAVLNAQLLPVTYNFVQSVVKDIKKRNINARMLMLKCDGSVYNIEDALEKPIETIFSGPAASMLGASYLSKLETCAVIDVGGTTTDVSAIFNNIPEISSSGAIIGGWKTRVNAMKMQTSATGGDSHVWISTDEIHLGPRRVVPLCVAAVQYTDFIYKLKNKNFISRRSLNENFQPTKFFVRTKYSPINAQKKEIELLQHIPDYPVSISEIISSLKHSLSIEILENLIKKRLVQTIGFTPTDALHVREEYTKWNKEAANIGASILSHYMKIQKYEFATYIKNLVAQNMARDLMMFLLPQRNLTLVEDVLIGKYHTKFSVQLPVVLLGGPVNAYIEEMNNLLDCKIIVPKYADVGNAVGALAGKGVKRVQMSIMPATIENPDQNFILFYPGGREQIFEYIDAYDRAKEIGTNIIYDYESRCGINKKDIKINISVKKIAPEQWSHPPIETRITMLGIGDPMMILRE